MGASASGLKSFFSYETVQIVRIRNVRVSLIYRLAQLLILAYIVGYGLIYKKAYQATGQVVGTADIKVKGVGYINETQPWYGQRSKPCIGNECFHVYDSYDLVVPPQEENALFVSTNLWVTKNQTRRTCQSYTTENSCATRACEPMRFVPNGRQTGMPGSCLTNVTDPGTLWPQIVPQGSFCEVYAWCPIELELTNRTLNKFSIRGVNSFTVFVRMNVNYPKFGITLDNTAGSNKTTNDVNLWTLERMVQLSGWEWEDVRMEGITLAMNAVWDCDFDKPQSQCAPKITFARLDDPGSKLSSGYNFRSLEYFHDKLGSRQLTKRYGVRLLVLISGVGSKFDFAALFTAIGAGIGLLSVATLIADFVATNLLHNRDVYRGAKYKEVDVAEEDEEERRSRRASRAAAAAGAGGAEQENGTGVYRALGGADGRGSALLGNSGNGGAPRLDVYRPNSPLSVHQGRLPYDEDDREDLSESWGRAHFPSRK